MRFSDTHGILGQAAGLVQADLGSTVAAYLEWQRYVYEEAFPNSGIYANRRSLKGKVIDLLDDLLPRTSPISTRALFLQTNCGWTAYFDNSRWGTDAGPPSVLAKRLSTSALRIVSAPHSSRPRQTSRDDDSTGLGATILEVYDKQGVTTRSIAVVFEGERWVFQQSGNPLPFEELERYKEKRVRERFTEPMLRRYLAQLAIDPLETESYPSASFEAVLVERYGNLPSSLEEH